ncbi:antibiotic biosynthesis monooxygenase family protein [Burkholderia guangdongensis]|uniref:antibiotic biosynthesis monooxygenase family protein n=1 Tax=Burkholderia guangdongensis TaxID=1792500 RepID=UPI0015C8BF27|nr:antibiotic biosynthesis monooxygenase family protein [Burkholderia guangdongensis]
MVHEFAMIEVLPGKEADFEAGVRRAVPLFSRAKGFRGVKLHRVIEHPGRYHLEVEWDTLDDHLVHFRQSEDFQEWRRIVGPFFKQPPEVIHTDVVVE